MVYQNSSVVDLMEAVLQFGRKINDWRSTSPEKSVVLNERLSNDVFNKNYVTSYLKKRKETCG